MNITSPDLLQNFIQIGIVGIALSYIVQFIKQKYGTDTSATKGLTVALAIVLGIGYYALVNTPLWQPIVGVLAGATTFYSLFINNGGNKAQVFEQK